MAEDPRIQPFQLGGGDDGVLLLHGFTGTPHEMRYLGERLAERGFLVRGARLTGHGLDPEALARGTAGAWIDDVRRELAALDGARRVFVAGLSMGALLAILIAAERPERIAAVALLAPALRFRLSVRIYLGAFRSERARRLVRFVKKGGSAVWDAAARAGNPTIERVPTSGAPELAEVVRRAEAALARVRAPALVVYSVRDPTVSPESAFEIERRIGSRPVRMVRLTDSFHVVTIDRDRDRVAGEVADFFRAAPPAAPA